MVLDFVIHAFQHPGGTTAIQRSFIDMPVAPKKTCHIRQVQVHIVEAQRIINFDAFYGISVDPDHVLRSFILLDSTMFLMGQYNIAEQTAIGQHLFLAPRTFMYPEGINCPYTRLPFFVQNSNTNAFVTNWLVKVFYEFVSLTAQELALAIVRRGRAVTRD